MVMSYALIFERNAGTLIVESCQLLWLSKRCVVTNQGARRATDIDGWDRRRFLLSLPYSR